MEWNGREGCQLYRIHNLNEIIQSANVRIEQIGNRNTRQQSAIKDMTTY